MQKVSTGTYGGVAASPPAPSLFLANDASTNAPGSRWPSAPSNISAVYPPESVRKVALSPVDPVPTT